jgi:Fe-S-cluster containining protein
MLLSSPMSDDPPEGGHVGPDLLAAMEQLAGELAARPEIGDLGARFEWVVDLLIARGHLVPGHRKLLGKIQPSRASVRLAVWDDKRRMRSPDIDCASLIPLCQGRCCSFTVELSAQDVVEKKVPWLLREPYVMPRNPATGYCTCMREEDHGCGIYQDRPGTCRVYDCREDTRVWIDYEKRIPAPMPEGVGLRPPEP